MTSTVLLTGFGPFPGAPFNPTGPLVMRLAQRRQRSLIGVRLVPHVFPTTYQAVDQELPQLLARQQPDVLLMFGLAQTTRRLRVETCARNALTRVIADASGQRPTSGMIAPDAPSELALRLPARRLLMAARSAGMPAALSRNAGSYLCNYLCWRACEAAELAERLRVVAFVHVPLVRRPLHARPARRRSPPFALDDLVDAGEAIVQAALASLRR
jgi:pyroglutamyl-peptidase